VLPKNHNIWLEIDEGARRMAASIATNCRTHATEEAQKGRRLRRTTLKAISKDDLGQT
jgi:hypothetical protein